MPPKDEGPRTNCSHFPLRVDHQICRPTPAPLRDRFLKLNHEHLSRRLPSVGSRGAHVVGGGAERLEGVIGHPAESCAEVIQIDGVFSGEIAFSRLR